MSRRRIGKETGDVYRTLSKHGSQIQGFIFSSVTLPIISAIPIHCQGENDSFQSKIPNVNARILASTVAKIQISRKLGLLE